METAIYGKKHKKKGLTPAVGLINPKYAHNVGAAVRAASCFGVKQIWFTGDRVSLDPKKGERLPREERMRGYKDVELRQFDYFFDEFDRSVTPVAIELRPNSESLTTFEHPENPLYVFGPEDGSIPSVTLRHCHRFVVIPTRHCVNLAAAVYIVLYDRLIKSNKHVTIEDMLAEERSWFTPPEVPNEDLIGVEGLR
jgi:tRNA(Leu) C34 or U34 (ribose-2'-O)-methylase TrmL